MKKWTRIFLIAILVIIAAGCINGGKTQNVTGETAAAETVVSDTEIYPNTFCRKDLFFLWDIACYMEVQT